MAEIKYGKISKCLSWGETLWGSIKRVVLSNERNFIDQSNYPYLYSDLEVANEPIA